MVLNRGQNLQNRRSRALDDLAVHAYYLHIVQEWFELRPVLVKPPMHPFGTSLAFTRHPNLQFVAEHASQAHESISVESAMKSFFQALDGWRTGLVEPIEMRFSPIFFIDILRRPLDLSFPHVSKCLSEYKSFRLKV
jgi:hypothetical protein